MNFYEFTLISTSKPKQFLMTYKHLTIVNLSGDTITLYYNNGNIFCKIHALEAFTFLDVCQINKPINKNTIPSMSLSIQTDSAFGSDVKIYNYGV